MSSGAFVSASGHRLVRPSGIEPLISTVSGWCLAAWPRPHSFRYCVSLGIGPLPMRTPGGTRTPTRQIRNLMPYPIGPRVHTESDFGETRTRIGTFGGSHPVHWKTKSWWPGAGSNRLHQAFQTSALPVELPGHWESRWVACTSHVYGSDSSHRLALSATLFVRGEGIEPPRRLRVKEMPFRLANHAHRAPRRYRSCVVRLSGGCSSIELGERVIVSATCQA